MKKILLISLIFGILVGIALVTYVKKVEATYVLPTNNYCHNNDGVLTTININALQALSHVRHGHSLTPGVCTTPVPSPTPSPTVVPSPTPTPEPTCEEFKNCEVEPTPTPTPTPVSDTGFPQPQNGVSGMPGGFVCADIAPAYAPKNFHVFRNGDQAKPTWFYDSNVNWKVVVYYGLPGQGDQHSVIFTNAFGQGLIKGLGNRDFNFRATFLNGCAQSESTAVVVDGSANGWVLFR